MQKKTKQKDWKSLSLFPREMLYVLFLFGFQVVFTQLQLSQQIVTLHSGDTFPFLVKFAQIADVGHLSFVLAAKIGGHNLHLPLVQRVLDLAQLRLKLQRKGTIKAGLKNVVLFKQRNNIQRRRDDAGFGKHAL